MGCGDRQTCCCPGPAIPLLSGPGHPQIPAEPQAPHLQDVTGHPFMKSQELQVPESSQSISLLSPLSEPQVKAWGTQAVAPSPCPACPMPRPQGPHLQSPGVRCLEDEAGSWEAGSSTGGGSLFPVQECSRQPASCNLPSSDSPAWLTPSPCCGPWTSLQTFLGLTLPTWECRC